MRDNDFVFAEGCGDRPVVSIGGCDSVRIEGGNNFVSGGKHAALALDPVKSGGALSSSANGKVSVSARTTVKGKITVRAEARELRELPR